MPRKKGRPRRVDEVSRLKAQIDADSEASKEVHSETGAGAAYAKYQSFKGKSIEWRQLHASEQLKICKEALLEVGTLPCLNETYCHGKYVSALGVKNHLERCKATGGPYKGARGRPEPIPIKEESRARKVGKQRPPEPEEGWLARYESYRDNFKAWQELNKKEQSQIIRYAFEGMESLSCLNYDICEATYTTYSGLLYHIDKCTEKYLYMKEEPEPIFDETKLPEYLSFADDMEGWRNLSQAKQRALVRSAFQMSVSSASCFKCQKQFTSAAGLTYHLERCTSESGIVKRSSTGRAGRPGRASVTYFEGKNPLDVYNSYMGRIADWRELTMSEKTYVLTYIFRTCPGEIRCLSDLCQLQEPLTSGGGWCYHLDRCSLPRDEQPWKCTNCKMTLTRGEKEEHIAQYHVQRFQDFDPEEASSFGVRKSAQKAMDKMAEILPMVEIDESDVTTKRSLDKDFEFSPPKQQSESDEEMIYEPIVEARTPITPKKRPSNFIRSASKRKQKKSYNTMNATVAKQYGLIVEKVYDYFLSRECDTVLFPEWTCPKHQWTASVEIEDYLLPLEVSVMLQLDDEIECRVSRFESRSSHKVSALFCGGPITSVAWCPINSPSNVQYLAIVAASNVEMDNDESPGLVQIWEVRENDQNPSLLESKLCYCFVHKFGWTLDVRWCPSGMIFPSEDDTDNFVRLGALALATSSGHVPIFCVPEPHYLTEQNGSVPTYAPEPVTLLQSPSTIPVCAIDWFPFGGHDKIVATRVDGKVILWCVMEPDNAIVLNTGTTWAGKVRACSWLSHSTVIMSFERQFFRVMDISSHNWIWMEEILGQGYSLVKTLPTVFPGFFGFGSYKKNGTFNLNYVKIEEDIYSAFSMRLRNRHKTQINDCCISPRSGDIFTVCHDEVLLGRYSDVSPHGVNDDTRSTVLESDAQVILRLIEERLADSDENPCYIYDDCTEKRKLHLFTSNFTAKTLDEDYSAAFPLSSLYRIAVCPNSSFCQLVCTGGQAGLLFVVKVEKPNTLVNS